MNKLKKAYGKFLSEKRKLNNSLFGNKDYRKFIVISRSRTGSTFLMALLNKHSNMICEGELFKQLNGNSCQTIWNNLFSKRPQQVKYVGCKLFYYHPFDDDKQVWNFIDQDKSIVIIHLTRKQYLEAYVSQKIGEKTKQWSESKFKPHNLSLEDKQVKLDLEECKETFEKIKKYETGTLERFKSHKIIEVDYSDLSKDSELVTSTIFEELSLPIEKLEVVNKKQNSEPLHLLIENFKELKEDFSDTPWSYLFD